MSIIGNELTFGGGGSGEPELLWTNPSPSASFFSKTVTVATGYSAYLIEFRRYVNSDAYSTLYVPFLNSERYAVCHLNYLTPALYTRKINSATDGAIVFGHCYDNDWDQDNYYYIPTRIWGVKWTI
ncbi:MAG: hypothetical protein IJS55_03340 [Oscillospiraceae bacterium]|nr:hypothetical protein [Oscillospiraceae bacterium]